MQRKVPIRDRMNGRSESRGMERAKERLRGMDERQCVCKGGWRGGEGWEERVSIGAQIGGDIRRQGRD